MNNQIEELKKQIDEKEKYLHSFKHQNIELKRKLDIILKQNEELKNEITKGIDSINIKIEDNMRSIQKVNDFIVVDESGKSNDNQKELHGIQEEKTGKKFKRNLINQQKMHICNNLIEDECAIARIELSEEEEDISLPDENDIPKKIHYYNAHPNIDKIWSETSDKIIENQTIYIGGKYPSRIIIPVMEYENKKINKNKIIFIVGTTIIAALIIIIVCIVVILCYRKKIIKTKFSNSRNFNKL